jgi:D-threo-aldose 1-dehydrogenase
MSRNDVGSLEKRSVPKRPIALTEISLGCAQLGNLYQSITDEQSRATVDAAWNQGVRYYDTAPHYGLGLSERRVGAALVGRPRSEYLVSTKVGRILEPLNPPGGRDDGGFDVPATHRRAWDFSRDGILRSFEESLGRLGLEHVDIVFLHDPDEHRREVLDTAYPALEELRAQGVVSAIGAGMNQVEMLSDFARHTDMDVFMLAGRYTLLEQSALDELLPLCEERSIGIVAAGVFNSGLLSRPKPADDAKYNYGDAPLELLTRARRIAEICERNGTSLPVVALAFPLAHPSVISVCVGSRSPAQIEGNIDSYHSDVPNAVWTELKEEGLLRRDAPVPT